MLERGEYVQWPEVDTFYWMSDRMPEIGESGGAPQDAVFLVPCLPIICDLVVLFGLIPPTPACFCDMFLQLEKNSEG